MPISAELLNLLACPKCKGQLHHRTDVRSLECNSCLLRYPIRDGIPILLVDEAENMKKN